ncbi:hypothetical protein BHE90_009105 [Fusarium euwallaceae]|uniref:Protein kinase domain-containing protein n=1 Tax=Fusarium euwallaceae TaxID=1147111 RepID=A0A430LL35_9HYPO|nr:hypothetical protein BHE90_009105 [Fusarium euwallaceae]
MPVISSIIRQPEANGLNVDLVCLDLDNVEKPIEDDSFGLPAPPETLSLVSFVDTLNVEQKDLGHIKAEALRGRPEPGQFGPAFGELPSEYIIGTGVSSTVMLLTPPEDIQASTTLVAYKRYTSAHHGPASDKKIYHWLWHELTTLCHPALRAHENICKLEHIAWEDTSILPILGLEFAHFGTLEDCLQDLRSYSSVARKSHLSLDIALGVAAIHSAGFVHGDLKPRNILVTRHTSRDVVAQISDLTGVAAASSYGATEFAIGTPTWQSPEALRRHQDTDWQLADVYSFGMVMATLWSAEGFIPPGGTFLDPHMQHQLDTDTKRSFIESAKLVPDEDEGSMTKLATQSLPPTGTTGVLLTLIVESTLCRHQQNRKPLQDVLTDCFLPWALTAGRDIPCLSTTVTEHQPSPACWNDNLVNAINTEYSSFKNRSTAFQANFFRALLAACETIKKSLPVDKLADLDEDTPYRGEELSRHINSIRRNIWQQSHRSRLIASALRSLGSSYIWGRGVDIDEQLGLEWYALAARLGSDFDQTMFCLLEEIAERRLSADLPRKLWCAIAIFDHGDVAASKYLKDSYPGLYASVEMSARMNRWSIINRLYISAMGEPNLQMGSSNVEIVRQRLDPSSVYGEDQRTALHLCAMAEERTSVEYLLLEEGANINATTTTNETPIFHAVRGGNFQVAKYLCQQGAETHHINEDGLTIFHLLPLMDDSDAAELAPMLIHGGAKLHHSATENCEYPFPWRGIGIPLFWAALKSRRELFVKLLSLHCTIGDRLSILEYKTLVLVLSICHHCDMLSLVVKAEPDLVHKDRQPSNLTSIAQLWQGLGIGNLEPGLTHTPGSPTLGPMECTLALLFSMKESSSFNLFRHLNHRKDFPRAKLATVELLLSLGADPVLPLMEAPARITAPYLAIYCKDTDLFKLFVEHVRSKGVDPFPILSDLDGFDGCTALYRAIDNDARGIFLFLLKTCPSLVNIPTRVGLTPLHLAAIKTWPNYARELLSYGASPYAEAENGLRPFEQAVAMNPDLEPAKEIADMIYRSSERDRLLGPSQKGEGCTAFDSILLSRNLTADRVEWFVQKYGKPSYHITLSLRKPISVYLGAWKTLPSHKAVNAQKAAVLKTLVKTFFTEINDYDDVSEDTRRTPLQIAALEGNVSAVQVLVEHGAELDLEAQGGRRFAGHTAAGMALVRKHSGICPPWVLRGGRQEKELFNNDMERILDILVRHGSQTAGSRADMNTSCQLMRLVNPAVGNILRSSHPSAA